MSEIKSRGERVYDNVRALYLALKTAQDEHGLPLRRAALRSNGEVAAEAIDFICDVELKARRTLTPLEFEMFRAGLDIPLFCKELLGEVFRKTRLSVGGDYKALFFHAKQVVDGKGLNSVEYAQIVDSTPTIDDYDKRMI